MRLFICTSVLVVSCCLAGCAGEIQDIKAEPAKAIQSTVGTAVNPTVAPQQEGSPGTASYTISVSLTIDPGQGPDGNADGQGKAAQ